MAALVVDVDSTWVSLSARHDREVFNGHIRSAVDIEQTFLVAAVGRLAVTATCDSDIGAVATLAFKCDGVGFACAINLGDAHILVVGAVFDLHGHSTFHTVGLQCLSSGGDGRIVGTLRSTDGVNALHTSLDGAGSGVASGCHAVGVHIHACGLCCHLVACLCFSGDVVGNPEVVCAEIGDFHIACGGEYVGFGSRNAVERSNAVVGAECVGSASVVEACGGDVGHVGSAISLECDVVEFECATVATHVHSNLLHWSVACAACHIVGAWSRSLDAIDHERSEFVERNLHFKAIVLGVGGCRTVEFDGQSTVGGLRDVGWRCAHIVV